MFSIAVTVVLQVMAEVKREKRKKTFPKDPESSEDHGKKIKMDSNSAEDLSAVRKAILKAFLIMHALPIAISSLLLALILKSLLHFKG
jgi:hypothetical protein